MTSLPVHTPNFSKRRRRVVRSMLHEATYNPGWSTLSDHAKLCYTIGLLICDETGRFTKGALTSALQDELLVTYAAATLAKAE